MRQFNNAKAKKRFNKRTSDISSKRTLSFNQHIIVFFDPEVHANLISDLLLVVFAKYTELIMLF